MLRYFPGLTKIDPEPRNASQSDRGLHGVRFRERASGWRRAAAEPESCLET